MPFFSLERFWVPQANNLLRGLCLSCSWSHGGKWGWGFFISPIEARTRRIYQEKQEDGGLRRYLYVFTFETSKGGNSRT